MKTNCLQSYQYWFKSNTPWLMPQLDFVTYFNQYFWIIIILSLCIMVMLKTILPNIKANLVSRVSPVIDEEKIKDHKEFIVFKKLLSL